MGVITKALMSETIASSPSAIATARTVRLAQANATDIRTTPA